ncbi:MAG: tyrosine-type recombinase/integrase [Victivallaceae bacterium]
MIRKRASEYHYEFMQSGKRYYGVCEGCTSERTALVYEKNIRDIIKKAATQSNHRALIENFKRELTGGHDIKLDSAFDAYLTKPAKRYPNKMRVGVNRRRWNDFVAFMTETYPDIIRIDQVLSKHSEEYINYLRNNGRFIREVTFTVKGKSKVARYTVAGTLTPQTINEYHQLCKSVFERLKDDAGIVINPFGFDAMIAKAESRDAFTLAELKHIGKNLDDFCRPLFIIGICTGLSLSDVCQLRWRDIHDNWIVRRRNKTGVALEIPMLPPLSAFINEQRQSTQDKEFVLPEHAEMYQTNRTGVSYRISEFLTRLGIETTRRTGGARRASIKDFHSLRHSFAYIAGIYQVPISIVQSILGHMTPEMTKHYQAHATREDKARYMKKLPDFLGATDTIVHPDYSIRASEHEREQVRQAVDNLSVEKIREIIAIIEK